MKEKALQVEKKEKEGERLKFYIDLWLKVLRGVRGYKTKDNELRFMLTYCDILEILKKFV